MTRKDKDSVLAALEELKGDCVGIIAATVEDCQAMVEQLPEEGGWIPVTLGFLPDAQEVRDYLGQHEDYPEYLVCIQGSRVPTVLKYCGGNIWVDDWGNWYKVTHWQPMPGMPKEG